MGLEAPRNGYICDEALLRVRLAVPGLVSQYSACYTCHNLFRHIGMQLVKKYGNSDQREPRAPMEHHYAVASTDNSNHVLKSGRDYSTGLNFYYFPPSDRLEYMAFSFSSLQDRPVYTRCTH